jgi:hypothetical protein
MAIFTLVSPTISIPNSFSISILILFPSSLADIQLGPFKHLTIISFFDVSVVSFFSISNSEIVFSIISNSFLASIVTLSIASL